MTRKVLQQALDALEYSAEQVFCQNNNDSIALAITAIKAALAQPEPFNPDWASYRQGKEDGQRQPLKEWKKQDIARCWFDDATDIARCILAIEDCEEYHNIGKNS